MAKRLALNVNDGVFFRNRLYASAEVTIYVVSGS